MVLDRYKEIVQRLYCEPKNQIIIGCFLTKDVDIETEIVEPIGPKRKKQKTKKNTPSSNPRSNQVPKNRDIRQLFFKQNEKNMDKKTIVID